MSKLKKVILIVVLAILVAGGTVGGFYAGWKYGAIAPREVNLTGITNAAPQAGGPRAADFNLFWQAWKIIKDDSLKGKDLSNQALIYGAVKGLMGSLDDPYSVFLPPTDAKKFNEDISGSFGGVGMEIGKKNGVVVVIAPLKNTPAEKAGVQAQDKILKIDDKFTDGLDVDEAVKLIRGPAGSEVKLVFLRDSWDAPKEIKIKRAVIDVPTVESEIKDGDIAYIKLSSFNEKAAQLFYEALQKASQARARGLVLDLRNDPGGYLEVAVNIAGWFVPKGELVVSERDRNGQGREFKSEGTGDLKNFPVVVLVNGGSASASEILAGALHDDLKTKLIGEKTFGKGTVQILKELTDGSTIKVTVANWVLPSGLIIDKNGIAPDIEVKLTDDDIKNKKDPQLDRALEEIKKEIAAEIVK